MWDVLFNLDRLYAVGLDAVVYLGLALVGTVLFVLRLGMTLLFGGADADMDTELAHGADGFHLISLLSVTAWMMGTGWAGLAARLEWGLSPAGAAAAAMAIGIGMMALASGLMFGAQRLQRSVTYEPSSAVGRTGVAYLAIPAKGQGRGQVRVSVSGRNMILDAASTGDAIDAFKSVRVVAVADDRTLIVEPAEV